MSKAEPATFASEADLPLAMYGHTLRESWVVLGMHRSGTSLMARLLQISGGELPKDLMAPSKANSLGYSEYQCAR